MVCHAHLRLGFFFFFFYTIFLSVNSGLRSCKHNMVFLLTQPPSPPEEPIPPPSSKDKDNNGSKKPSSKGKAAGGNQQVDVQVVFSDESRLRTSFELSLLSPSTSGAEFLTGLFLTLFSLSLSPWLCQICTNLVAKTKLIVHTGFRFHLTA